MGIAVGGPFMHGKSLILYNSTEHGGLRALYNGEPILNETDDAGNADFHAPFDVYAARRADWDSQLHDQAILDMVPVVNFSVSTWPGRFTGQPLGGLYLIQLPEGVEITATGVDFMSVVIKMTKVPGGQTGFCGNFNGSPDDESEPPPENSVPPNLLPAWNFAAGPDLGPVEDKDNLFLRWNETADMIHWYEQPSLVQRAHERLSGEFGSERMREAEAECAHLIDAYRRYCCIIDVILTGHQGVAKASAEGELLALGFKWGIPVYIGRGRCQDPAGNFFRAFRALDIDTNHDCLALLQKLGQHEPIRGAQLSISGSCEILVTPEVDLAFVQGLLPEGSEQTLEDTGRQDQGSGLVTKATDEVTWTCFRAN